MSIIWQLTAVFPTQDVERIAGQILNARLSEQHARPAACWLTCGERVLPKHTSARYLRAERLEVLESAIECSG